MKEKDKITVEAVCNVSTPLGSERWRTFSAAWARAMELPTPVKIEFVGFVRKVD